MPSISPTESQIMVAIRAWLLVYCPDYTIIQGQQNNIPTPLKPFGILQILSRTRTATNAHYYGDKTVTLIENLNLCVQFSAFGEHASDDMMRVQSLWRDPLSCDWFAQHLPSLMPTYADEPEQKPFITAEKQYESLWMITLHANVNFSATYPIETARALTLDALYHI